MAVSNAFCFGNRLLRLPIAGGNWNNGANAGVFYLNLNNLRSNSNSNIGFRSALPLQCQISRRSKDVLPVQGDKGVCFRSDKEKNNRLNERSG